AAAPILVGGGIAAAGRADGAARGAAARGAARRPDRCREEAGGAAKAREAGVSRAAAAPQGSARAPARRHAQVADGGAPVCPWLASATPGSAAFRQGGTFHVEGYSARPRARAVSRRPGPRSDRG